MDQNDAPPPVDEEPGLTKEATSPYDEDGRHYFAYRKTATTPPLPESPASADGPMSRAALLDLSEAIDSGIYRTVYHKAPSGAMPGELFPPSREPT